MQEQPLMLWKQTWRKRLKEKQIIENQNNGLKTAQKNTELKDNEPYFHPAERTKPWSGPLLSLLHIPWGGEVISSYLVSRWVLGNSVSLVISINGHSMLNIKQWRAKRPDHYFVALFSAASDAFAVLPRSEDKDQSCKTNTQYFGVN